MSKSVFLLNRFTNWKELEELNSYNKYCQDCRDQLNLASNRNYPNVRVRKVSVQNICHIDHVDSNYFYLNYKETII